MATHVVYKDPASNALFSEGITRAFGQNKCVSTKDEVFLASVQPLKCDPEECGLIELGTIDVET